MKRILVAHNVSSGRTGGMSRIMGYIHDRVAQRGFDVHEFNTAAAPAYAKGRLARFGFGWSVFRHIRDEFLAGRPYDIVNVHEPSAAFAIALSKFCGDPIIVATSHGVEQRAWELALEELDLGRAGPSRKTQFVYPRTQLVQSNYSLRRADHIFCLNEDDKAFIVARFSRSPAHITRIFPAADVNFANGATSRDYSRCRSLLFAGVWRKNKGVEDLVPAFSQIHREHPDLKLTIFGGGFSPEFILNHFPLELRGSVLIRQSSSESETIQVFSDADLFVLPSLFEGTPLVLMEAMMSGLPVITTATCGMKDVIESGRNGLLIPIRSPAEIASAVTRFISDASFRQSCGQSAFLDAKAHFTWDRVSESAVAAYERLLENH